MPTFIVSLMRTYVPLAAGGLITWFLSVSGVSLDRPATGIVLYGLATGGYYLLARAIESVFPSLGKWLVGLGAGHGGPQYSPASRAYHR